MSWSFAVVVSSRLSYRRFVLTTRCCAYSSMSSNGTGGPSTSRHPRRSWYILRCPGLGCTSPHWRTQVVLYRVLCGLVTVVMGTGAWQYWLGNPVIGAVGVWKKQAIYMAHSANHYVAYPGNTPANPPPPYRSVHDPFKMASGVQHSGPWDLWLRGVEKSRLFAQRGHSARCAP